MKTVSRCGFFTLALLAISSISQAQTIDIYLSAPASQQTIYGSTTTETFDTPGTGPDTLALGNRTTDFHSIIGTYQLSPSNPFNIQADNQYGTGTGNYMAIGAQSGTSAPFTLQLNSPQKYFGFSWNAGDNNNGLTFYNGSTQLVRFSSQTIQTLLSAPTVTALDGTVYFSSQYKGKPPSGAQNSTENYAFLNFVVTSGTFDRIVFDNSGLTSSGFESDNHTITAISVVPNPKFVYAGSFTTPPGQVGTTPEPGALPLMLCAVGVLGFAMTGAKLRRKPIRSNRSV